MSYKNKKDNFKKLCGESFPSIKIEEASNDFKSLENKKSNEYLNLEKYTNGVEVYDSCSYRDLAEGFGMHMIWESNDIWEKTEKEEYIGSEKELWLSKSEIDEIQ